MTPTTRFRSSLHVLGLFGLPGLLGLAVQALVSVGVAMCLTTTAQAQDKPHVIERVMATVNDSPIFLSDLRQRALPILARAQAELSGAQLAEAQKAIYQQALDLLVEEKLFRQEATRLRIRVTRADEDAAIGRVRAQYNLSIEEFWEALRGEGIAEAQYREDMRRQLLRSYVIDRRVRSRIHVSEERIRQVYDTRFPNAARWSYHIAHVVLPLSTEATFEDVESTRQEMADIRTDVTAETFDAAIEAYGGADLGWITEGELPDVLNATVVRLTPGMVSQPIRGPQGIHLLLLRERTRTASDVPEFEEVSAGIQQELLTQEFEAQSKLFVERLKRDATVVLRL